MSAQTRRRWRWRLGDAKNPIRTPNRAVAQVDVEIAALFV